MAAVDRPDRGSHHEASQRLPAAPVGAHAGAKLAASGDSSLTGVVLAGGRGRRMGGVDKGLQLLQGRPLIAHVLARLAPQVGELMINANQNLDRYAQFGFRVIPDALSDFAGPLAGLQAGLAAASSPMVLTVPCDSPFLPGDLAIRLKRALEQDSADLAVARTFEQVHPVFALVRRAVLPDLERFLAGGGRKIDAWYAKLAVAEVVFDDEPESFANINTREDLTRFDAPESRRP